MLIHDGGFGTDAELCWGPVVGPLANDFHVFAPDLLGWGGSDKVAFFDRSPYEFRIDRVSAVCRTLALDEPMHFVGASFGGELLVRAVVEESRPWPVRTAVSITGTGGRLFRVPDAFQRLVEYEPSPEAAAALTEMLVASSEGLEEHNRRRYENSLIAGHWEALMAPRTHNPAVPKPVPPEEFPEALRRCPVPILFIEGARDLLLEKGWAAELARYAPKGESMVLDAAHEPNIDRAELVVSALSEFFARHREREPARGSSPRS
jgi:pimeloyl-ACP methyl ester carboxylesterase